MKVSEKAPKMQNPGIEAPGLEMRDFIKRSIRKLQVSEGVPKMRNPTLEAPIYSDNLHRPI